MSTKTMIRTSELNCNINWKNINDDFDIFLIKLVPDEGLSENEKNKYIGAHIVDVLDSKFSALSVLYLYGNRMFCLYQKGAVKGCELKDKIEQQKQIKVEVSLIKNINDNSFNSNKETCIYINELIQLLCNMVANYDSEQRYHNLSGRLYYLTSNSVERYKKTNKVKQIITYEIQINGFKRLSNELKININLATFTPLSNFNYVTDKRKKEEILSKPKYIIDENGIFRRKTKTDQLMDDNIFIKKTNNSRNVSPFLEFGNINDFMNSKMGVLYQFKNDCKEYLSPYFSFEFKMIEKTKKTKKNSENLIYKKEKDYFKKFNDRGLLIINKISDFDPLSKELERLLIEKLVGFGVKNVMKANICDSNKYNISIIHEPKFYEINDIEDEYENNLFTQHIMFERCIKSKKDEKKHVVLSDSEVKKLIYELMIKYDLQQERLSLCKWDAKSTLHYAFAKWEDDDETDEEKLHFPVLSISPAAEINYQYLTDENDELYKTLSNAVDYHLDKYIRRTDLNGIITDGKNTVLFVDNNIFTIPNLDEIHSILNRYSKTKQLSSCELIEMLFEFGNDNEVYKEEINVLIENINSSNKKYYTYEEITNGSKKENAVVPLISLSRKIAKDFVLFAKEKYRLIINPMLKNEHNEEVLNSSLTQIQTYRNELDCLDERLFYFVGYKKGVSNYSVPTSVHIRSIVPINRGCEWIEDLNNQLNVDFVRISGFTVIPYPFKYLREVYNKNKD